MFQDLSVMEESAKASLLDNLISYYVLILYPKLDTAPSDGSSLVMPCFHLVLATVEEEEAGEGSRAE